MENPATYTSHNLPEIQTELRLLAAMGHRGAARALKTLTTPAILQVVKDCDADIIGVTEAADTIMDLAEVA